MSEALGKFEEHSRSCVCDVQRSLRCKDSILTSARLVGKDFRHTELLGSETSPINMQLCADRLTHSRSSIQCRV